MLVAPKDKDIIPKKSGEIYQFKYNQAGCNDEYIGELGQTFGDRLKEYLRDLSSDIVILQGITSMWDSFPIAGRITKTIKETTFIRVNDPSLNRNLGKYQLPHILDEVLQDISALHLR